MTKKQLQKQFDKKFYNLVSCDENLEPFDWEEIKALFPIRNDEIVDFFWEKINELKNQSVNLLKKQSVLI